MTTIEEALALVAGLTSEQIRAFMATQLASQEAVTFETMTAGVSHDVLVLVSARALVRRWRVGVADAVDYKAKDSDVLLPNPDVVFGSARSARNS